MSAKTQPEYQYVLLCPKCKWSCPYVDHRVTCWECGTTLVTKHVKKNTYTPNT